MSIKFEAGEMTDKHRGVFWNGFDGNKRVMFGVSREALDDFCAKQGYESENILDAYRTFKSVIWQIALELYTCGRFETDGSILVRTADFSAVKGI